MRSPDLGYMTLEHRFDERKNGSLKMGFRRKMGRGQHNNDKEEERSGAQPKRCMYVYVSESV